MPYTDDGYSTTTDICYDVTDAAIQTALKASEAVVYNADSGPFVICDYGSGDGQACTPLINAIISNVKTIYGDDTEVEVIQHDLPQSNFSDTFCRLHGEKPMNHRSINFLDKHSNVYVTACAGDFYRQCLPSNRVHLGLNFLGLHYISHKPCSIPDNVLHLLSTNEDAKQKFADCAAVDLEHFLLSRAKELTPGGQMVIGSHTVDKDGHYATKSSKEMKSCYECLNHYWTKMLNDKQITREEFEKAAFVQYLRTTEEFAQPFTDPASAVSNASLKLISQQVKYLKDPDYPTFLTTKQTTADAEQYAKVTAGTRRLWHSHYFSSALANSRDETQKQALMDTLFGYYEADITEHPLNHAQDLVTSYVHFMKNL